MIIAKEHLTAEGRLKIKSLIDKFAAKGADIDSY
jgi:hypothetical protein